MQRGSGSTGKRFPVSISLSLSLFSLLPTSLPAYRSSLFSHFTLGPSLLLRVRRAAHTPLARLPRIYVANKSRRIFSATLKVPAWVIHLLPFCLGSDSPSWRAESRYRKTPRARSTCSRTYDARVSADYRRLRNPRCRAECANFR